MGFNLYFAGADRLTDPIPPESGCGVLNTFALGPKRLDKFLDKTEGKIFIDSGAFSVYHSGAKVDIDEYVDYINSHDKPTVWACLDVIPYPDVNEKLCKASAEGTWEKYLYIMDRLDDDKRDKFIPIYHFGEPPEALERMINTEVHGRIAPYIGIGGRHGVGKETHKSYYNKLFGIINETKNPNVKIHAFGMTMPDLLEAFPFYSADSTTWLMTSINGKIHCYANCKTFIVSDRQTNSVDHISNIHPSKRELILEEIEKYGNGVTLEQLSNDYTARLKYNRDFFMWWAQNYQYKGKQKFNKRKTLF